MGHPNNTGKYAHLSIPVPGPGCKPKYDSPEQLEKLIDEYFASCWEEDWREEYIGDSKEKQWVQKFDHEGNPMMRLRERPTVTGLALALGFTTRLALIGYQNRDEFKDVIERAKLTVEKYYESGTVEGSVPQIAGIFALKNFALSMTSKNSSLF